MDDRFGLGGEVGWLGLEVEVAGCRIGGEEVAAEDSGEGRTVQSVDESREKIAAVWVGHSVLNR
jgi:hypothetical protein